MKKKSKNEIFLRNLKKIPEEKRSWNILKEPADLEISSSVGKPACKILYSGQTEEIWNRAIFENEIIDWFKTKPIPEFLLN